MLKTNYLNFGQDGNNRDDDTEDKVEADDNLVLFAVIRLRVVNIEQHNSGESQSVIQEGERQQAWESHEDAGQ